MIPEVNSFQRGPGVSSYLISGGVVPEMNLFQGGGVPGVSSFQGVGSRIELISEVKVNSFHVGGGGISEV